MKFVVRRAGTKDWLDRLFDFWREREQKKQNSLLHFIEDQQYIHKQLVTKYNDLSDKLEVLSEMGITPQSDGSWLFNFRKLFGFFDGGDFVDIRTAMAMRAIRTAPKRLKTPKQKEASEPKQSHA